MPGWDLKQLHDQQYCHGDVRRYNVVFGEEGRLIDFDFAGQHDVDVYPKDLVVDLADVVRHKDITEEALEKGLRLRREHDLAALASVMEQYDGGNKFSEAAKLVGEGI